MKKHPTGVLFNVYNEFTGGNLTLWASGSIIFVIEES